MEWLVILGFSGLLLMAAMRLTNWVLSTESNPYNSRVEIVDEWYEEEEVDTEGGLEVWRVPVYRSSSNVSNDS